MHAAAAAAAAAVTTEWHFRINENRTQSAKELEKVDIFMPLHYIERSLHASALLRMSPCVCACVCCMKCLSILFEQRENLINSHTTRNDRNGNFDELNLIQL
jgi:hypothetical protein